MRRRTFDRTANNPPHRRSKKAGRKKLQVEDQTEFEKRVPKLTTKQLRFIQAYRTREPDENIHQSLVRALTAAGYAARIPELTGEYILNYNWAGALLRAVEDSALSIDTELLDRRLAELETGDLSEPSLKNRRDTRERRSNGRSAS